MYEEYFWLFAAQTRNRKEGAKQRNMLLTSKEKKKGEEESVEIQKGRIH